MALVFKGWAPKTVLRLVAVHQPFQGHRVAAETARKGSTRPGYHSDGAVALTMENGPATPRETI